MRRGPIGPSEPSVGKRSRPLWQVEGSVVRGHTAFAAPRSTGGERAVPQMAVLLRRRYAVNGRRRAYENRI